MLDCVPQKAVQLCQPPVQQVLGNRIVGLGNAASDGGNGVTVAADGNGQPKGIGKILTFRKSNDGLGHRPLTTHIELVCGANFIQGKGQVVVIRRDRKSVV